MTETGGFGGRTGWGCLAVGLLALGLLAGCATGQEAKRKVSPPKLAQPVLWTGEGAAEGTIIKADGFNGGRQTIGETRVDYIGMLNPDNSFEGSPAETAEVEIIRKAGATREDLDGKLTVNFENDPLDYFVRQMLGGFLGVNYLTAGELAGTVTFRTEQPIARSQVLAVVRSILAQKGYVMKMIGGVIHIAPPELATSAERTAAVGRQDEIVTRVVPFGRPVDESLVRSLGEFLPDGVSVQLSPDRSSMIVRATPEEIGELERLVRSFNQPGTEKNFYAIVYLHHSSPDNVAGKLTAFFSSQTFKGQLAPNSVIPLEGRQALLIAASSEAAIENVRKIATQLDFGLEDEVTLRIIPLRHTGAADIATQLNSVFSGDAGNPTVTVSEEKEGKPAVDDGIEESDEGDEDSGPVPIHKRVARAFEDRPTGSISVDTARPVTIVADERNNALLVRSSYRLFQRIRDAVKVLDVPLSQVVIEATILEVKITDALKYGVQWYLAGNGFTLRNSSSSTVSDSGLTGLVATAEQLASGISVTAVIDALDDVTDVSVVSSPYLTVMDRKTARLVVGDQIPFTTTSQTVSNDGESVINQNIEIKDTGVILEVQPVIRADNSIELHIVQELSSAELAASLSTLTPTVTTRQITSDIMVYSGRTVLLGGLIQDRKDEQKTGIPLLRQAPVVGKLFEQTSTTDTRTEVIVLITPRVARKSGEIERITEQLRQHLRLSGTFPDRPADEAAD